MKLRRKNMNLFDARESNNYRAEIKKAYDEWQAA